MKKTFGMLAVVLVVFTFATSLALAQQGQRLAGGQRQGLMQGFGAQNEIRFLFNEKGREDFGLTEDETTKIREALREAVPQRNQDATPEERREAMEKSTAEAMKKLGEILTKEQMEKLQTRAFQFGGYAGLNGRYAQKALKITDEQKKKWLYSVSGLTHTSAPTRDWKSDLPRERTL